LAPPGAEAAAAAAPDTADPAKAEVVADAMVTAREAASGELARNKVFCFKTYSKGRFLTYIHISYRNLRTRRRMHLCMQDDQNGQKTMVLTSAEETDLFYTITKYFFCSEQPSLTADVNTIILQVYTYLICLQS
jgi:hypothetical protein